MLQYKFNLEKSPTDNRDYMLESIYPVSVVLPEVWDLRKELPAVRDQGTQGTCMAQSSACMKEWQERIDVGYKGYMSPQFVYNIRANQTSEGMNPRDALQILNKIGIVFEKDFPYGTMSKPNEKLMNDASIYRIAGYAAINTVDSLKKALYANGPCNIDFPVYNPEKMEFWKQDFTNQQSLGGHAVTAVGWLKDSFIIRNSWSSGWGDGGYCYLPFSDWGMQWECWTTLDADSNPDAKFGKGCCGSDRMGFFKKLFSKKLNRR